MNSSYYQNNNNNNNIINLYDEEIYNIDLFNNIPNIINTFWIVMYMYLFINNNRNN